MPSMILDLSQSSEKALSVPADTVLIPIYQIEKNKEQSESNSSSKQAEQEADIEWTIHLKDLESETGFAYIFKDEKFTGAYGKTLVLRKTELPTIGARRLVFVGLGPRKKNDPMRLQRAFEKAGSIFFQLDNARNVAIYTEDSGGLDLFTFVQAAVDGIVSAGYCSLESNKKKGEYLVTVLSEMTRIKGNDLKIIAEMTRAKSKAKDLVNMPPNIKRTDTLVEEAKALENEFQVSVYEKDWIEKEMPCFFTVARGSLDADPPKFIELRRNKAGAEKKIAIIGKSVIFDTGGYQLKPGSSMNTMKADMTGGASLIGIMNAVKNIDPPVSIYACMAATPNYVNSHAMVPDSIVNTTCGKKVEIRHTDAEGRLTLIDAVAMAEREKPDVIITVATLTGSASRAVGMRIALMSNNKEYLQKFEESASKVGDAYQSLDVSEDDFDDIKSKLDGADIINTSQKVYRGAQSAAAFVMSGLSTDIPLIHLDIAGADMSEDDKATGCAVKAVLQFILDME